MKKNKNFIYAAVVLCCISLTTYAQRVPNEVENIDYVVTYGKQASPSLGDDDHVQIIFFSIPLQHNSPIYLRIYDPDTGGTHDDLHGAPDTYVRYSIYGGEGAFSNKDAQRTDPLGEFKSGTLLVSKTFGADSRYNASWFILGVLNPLNGEKSDLLSGRVFKLIVEGLKGNDGNQYRCFLSQLPNVNQAVEGANAFAYEYTFTLPKARGISHIYPFVDASVTSITQSNFDYDKDGEILIYSVKKNRHQAKVSRDFEWAKSSHPMEEEEKNTTIDVQIQKNTEGENAMSFYITNQYDEAIPFFNIPIGGPPKYKYSPTILLKSSQYE